MKILIVDDSTVMRKVIMRELVQLGFTKDDVVEAEDGIKGLEAASAQVFDVILMDWNMPGMLGIDVVRKLRASGITTPIMMVTTEGEKTNVIVAIQAGANNYLIKPFTSDDFAAKFKQMLAAACP